MSVLMRIERNYKKFQFSSEQAKRILDILKGVSTEDIEKIADYIIDNNRYPPLPKDFVEIKRTLGLKSVNPRGAIKSCQLCKAGFVTAICKEPKVFRTKNVPRPVFYSNRFKCPKGCADHVPIDSPRWSEYSFPNYVLVRNIYESSNVEKALKQKWQEELNEKGTL